MKSRGPVLVCLCAPHFSNILAGTYGHFSKYLLNTQDGKEFSFIFPGCETGPFENVEFRLFKELVSRVEWFNNLGVKM